MWYLVSCEAVMSKPWCYAAWQPQIVNLRDKGRKFFIRVLSTTGLSVLLLVHTPNNITRITPCITRIESFIYCTDVHWIIDSHGFKYGLMWVCDQMAESIHLAWLEINHEITIRVLVYDGIVYIKSHNEEKSGQYLMNIPHCNAN